MTMAGRKIRFGLVGCGRIADKHIEAIEAHGAEAELVAVADVDAQALERAVARTGARGFSSIDAMLAGAEVDCVVLATPRGLHARGAVAAAAAGGHLAAPK